jgi:hypothetical protein
MDFMITLKFSGEELFLKKIYLEDILTDYIYKYKDIYIEDIQRKLALNPSQISYIYKLILNKTIKKYIEIHYKKIQTCDSSFFNYKCALEIPFIIDIERILKRIN